MLNTQPLAAPTTWCAALLLALGGCATRTESLPWRIEPVQTVTHGLGGSAEGYYVVGRQIELGSRDWLRAADAYRQALKLDPGHVDARNALAVALARLGLMPDAEAQLRMALQAAPQRADLHSNLGYLLLLAGRSKEAQEALHAALALNPRDGVAQANLELAQGRVAASTVPGSGTVDAAATAREAAATKSAAVEVPSAAAPTQEAPAPAAALRVLDGATLAPLATAAPTPGLAPAAPMAAPALDGAGAARPPAVTTTSPQEAAAPSPSAPPGAFTLELSNGMGRRGAAVALRQQFQQQGFKVHYTSNQPPYRQPYTVVLYRPGQEAAARQVSRALPLSAPLQTDAGQRAGVRVLIGRDWPAEAAGVRVAAAGGTTE
ncbi:LytR C-terminal domain-containing protein [Azohydromonas australica]|uniref:LytR C-terminal domain-containing protein n=1 Tax=Azohydromonas australica TaxID=364039 RepID=UPI00040F69BC|nr:LytR C-terminal domain-containing protein [Azohydromonas australica]